MTETKQKYIRHRQNKNKCKQIFRRFAKTFLKPAKKTL